MLEDVNNWLIFMIGYGWLAKVIAKCEEDGEFNKIEMGDPRNQLKKELRMVETKWGIVDKGFSEGSVVIDGIKDVE